MILWDLNNDILLKEWKYDVVTIVKDEMDNVFIACKSGNVLKLNIDNYGYDNDNVDLFIKTEN